MMPMVIKAQGEHFVFTTAWKAQAQFAGYYVAYEKGFYRKEGLDVEIQHPTLTSSALTRLKSQECDAAMFSLMSAMDFISQGFPLVNIFQDSMNSSNMLISRWDTDPLKMKGKKVAIFNSDPNYLTFIMDRREGMHYEWIPFTSGINLFLSGAVDATMVVSYNEYYQLIQAGFKMSDESVYRFSDHDYNIQETGVYVKRDYYLKHRSACQKFAKASRQGWEWAAKHPKEALDIVMKYVDHDHIDQIPDRERCFLFDCFPFAFFTEDIHQDHHEGSCRRNVNILRTHLRKQLKRLQQEFPIDPVENMPQHLYCSPDTVSPREETEKTDEEKGPHDPENMPERILQRNMEKRTQLSIQWVKNLSRHHDDHIEPTPDQKCPCGAMPEPGRRPDPERRETGDGKFSCTLSEPGPEEFSDPLCPFPDGNRIKKIIAEPVPERHMPSAPEIFYRNSKIRLVKVLFQRYAENM